jgi:hypothetical protein
MHSEIASYLERLLFHNDTVVLPGLGAFLTQDAPSSIDYAGGTVAPPSKILIFNDNLTTDDGLLTYELVQEKGISDQEAKAWVDERIAAIMTQLNQREIVQLPGIGRLYKNYVQRIQFLPDAANFSRENFGLPPLQFSPLTRSREVSDNPTAAVPGASTTTPPATSPTTTTTTATPAASIPVSQTNQKGYQPSTNTTPPSFDTPPPAGQQWMRGLLILALLVLSGAIGYYFLRMQQQKTLAKQEQTELPADQNTTETPTDNNKEAPQEPAPKAVPSPTPEPKKPEVATPAPAPKPAPPTTKAKDKNCVLIVGLFKDPNNIARLKNLFEKNGFETYSAETSSGATSLGVQFKYGDQSEVNANIAKLQKLTGEKNIRVKK